MVYKEKEKNYMKKIVAALTISALLTFSVSAETKKTTANQIELSLSNETLNFVSEHNIDLKKLSINSKTKELFSKNKISSSAYIEDSIKAIKDEAEVYNFTTEQIQNYINATLSSTPIIARSKADAEREALNNPVATFDYYADNRVDDGIGWEVKSLPQFSKATTFVNLPTVLNKVDGTAPYMFYTVSTDNNRGWAMDIGVGYENGDTGVKWRGFYLTSQPKNESNSAEKVKDEMVYDQVGSVDSNYVYFIAELLDGSNTGYLNFKVLNGNNFNVIYYNLMYYVGDKGLFNTNTSFNKQITLCNPLKQFNTGVKILNARFSQSYLYSTPNNTNSLMLPSNCEDGEIINNKKEPNRCGKFGTDKTNVEQVTQNSSTKWYSENISISF